MKLTAAEKARYKALLAKAAADLSADEKTELETLKGKAVAAGYDPAKDDGSLSSEEVTALVDEGVRTGLEKALKDLKIDDQITKAVTDSLKDKKGITADELTAAIKAHLGGTEGIDAKKLTEDLKKSLADSHKGITKEQLDEALKEMSKGIRTASKHEFGGGENADAFPIEHRSGNLSVSQKQLLNILMGSVSESALRNSNGGKGIKRPAFQDEGIDADMLKNAVARGEMAAKSLRQSIMFQGLKAITTTGSGTGAELVNTDLSSQLLMRFYLESQVAAEFLSQEIEMPSDPFKLPMVTTRPTFYVGSEAPGSDPTGSTPGTANPTLTTGKLIGLTEYSYESDEDSVVAVLPMIQEGLAAGAADSYEGAIINGDADGTHQDSDIEAVSGHYAKLFNGLRKAALGVTELKVDVATGGINAANFLAVKKAMVKYGVRPRDLIAIVGVKGYNDFVGLEETLTAEKVGNSQARILTGEAPNLYGVRIIVSSQVREDLNASGVYAAASTKGSFLLVHRPSWMVGTRRGFTVEVDVDKKRQINVVVASFRRAFTPKETPSAAQAIVAMGYNYAS